MRICSMRAGLCLQPSSMHQLLPFVQSIWLIFLQIGIIIIMYWPFTGTYGYSDFFDSAMGMLTPLSHVPHMLLHYGDEMTYVERVHNLIITLFDWYYRNFVTLPKQNEIAQKYFGHLNGLWKFRLKLGFIPRTNNLILCSRRVWRAFTKCRGNVSQNFLDSRQYS